MTWPILVAALLLMAVAAPPSATAGPRLLLQSAQGKVIHVDDGDTIVVLLPQNDQVRIRLANIDAPEASHGQCRPGQPYSAQSTQMLRSLTLGYQAQLQCNELDRYDRQICTVTVAGRVVNREMVRAGLAWANRANPRYLRDPAVAEAEDLARKEGIGLWSQPSPIAPWTWRQTAWKQQPTCPPASN